MNSLNAATSLISKSKASTPNFPTYTTLFPGSIGNYQSANMDGDNCVFSTQGGRGPSTNAYLYWSNNFGATLNRATIGGLEQQFFGCVAISGQYAVAMGKVGNTSATARFYFSSDYGRSYTLASTTGSTATTTPGVKIVISGTKAMWSSNQSPAYYLNLNFTNNTATWTQVVANGLNVDLKMFETNAYVCCFNNNSSANGFQYSTNSGANFTKNTFIGVSVMNCAQVGTNIYVGGYNGGATVIYKLTGGPGSNPTTVVNSPGGSGGYMQGVACCPRSSGDDFVIFYTDTNGAYYSNNGGTSFVLAPPNVASSAYTHTICANSTRIIMGGQNGGIWWGKNAYIT